MDKGRNMPPIIQIFEFFLASPKQPNATPLRIFFPRAIGARAFFGFVRNERCFWRLFLPFLENGWLVQW